MVRESRVNGRGLFATIPIELGTVILHLSGHVMSLREYLAMCPNFEGEWHCRPDEDERPGQGQIVYRRKRTSFSYINHSRTPDVRIGHAFGLHGREDRLIATLPIGLGEEILLDYRDYVPDEYLVAAADWI